MTSKIDIAERESSTNRSLERALHLLMVMEDVGSPQSLTELAASTRLAKATVQRILSVLERYDLVEKRLGRYHLGVAVLPLAHGYLLTNELSRAALPALQELAGATRETASLPAPRRTRERRRISTSTAAAPSTARSPAVRTGCPSWGAGTGTTG